MSAYNAIDVDTSSILNDDELEQSHYRSLNDVSLKSISSISGWGKSTAKSISVV